MISVILRCFVTLSMAHAQSPDPSALSGPSAAADANLTEPSAFTGERWALVIGINDYSDPDIVDLEFATADARAIAAVLQKGGVPADHIVIMDSLQEDPSLRPTRNNVLVQVARLQRSADGAGQVLVFYSGHGMGRQDAKGVRHNYLIPADASLELPESTALDLAEIVRLVDAVNAADRLVVVDACRNRVQVGARAVSPDSTFVTAAPSDTGRTKVLFSSSFGEVSYEDARLGMGRFTWSMVDGLRCAADGAVDDRRDSVVTLDELVQYTGEQLNRSERPGREQNPVLVGGSTEDFPLAMVGLVCEPVKTPRPELWAQPAARRATYLGAAGAAALLATIPTYMAWRDAEGDDVRLAWGLSNYGLWTAGVGLSGAALVVGTSGVLKWHVEIQDWRAEDQRASKEAMHDDGGSVAFSVTGHW